MNSLQILNFIWLLNLNILENNSYGNNTQIIIMETIPNGNIENRVGIFNKQKNGSGKHLLYQEVKPFKSFKFL